MAEGARLESVLRQRIGGSNPPLTAIFKEELYESASFFFAYCTPGGMRSPDGVRQLAQPVGQTTNAVSGLPQGERSESIPPLTAIFKEELYESTSFFSHFICLYGSERYKIEFFFRLAF